MGCVCGKPSSAVDDSPKQRELIRKTSELRMARAVSRKKNECFSSKDDKLENGEIKIGLIDRKSNGSRRVRDDYYEKKREKDSDDDIKNFPPSIRNLPKAIEGEQVAAGWPSWLVEVAGEAIKGWVPRKAETFEKLDKIGQGTYSSVYKGRDLMHNKFVALKKVRFDNMDPESVKFMAREIHILRRLNHPNVIKLEGLVTSKTSCSLYLVFEYMEHDLTGLSSIPGVKFTEPQVKCYMKQLLSGLDHCHSNGILHRDIKGSNLLIDNNGILKIADFGLASYFDCSQRVPLTSRVVTLWYRPPELLLGATQYGVAVDLWSTGCILGELYAGKPIMPGRTEVEQLHKIFKLCGSPSEDYWRNSKLPHSPVFKPIQPYRRRIAETFKNIPETATGALHLLPFRVRQGAIGVKSHKCENDYKRSKESQSATELIANADLARSIQRRHGNVNPKCRDELFDPKKDGNAPGSDNRQNHQERVSSSGLLGPRASCTLSGRKISDNNTSSYFLPSRNNSCNVEPREKVVSSFVGPTNQTGRLSESFGDPMRKQDRRSQPKIFCGSRNEEKMGKQEEDVTTMHFSGPLLATSNNIEKVLKEHDFRIQEAARRIRKEKMRVDRVRAR
ncbi:protein kinase superfamily protein [Striga asiatica]|uniref:Protein kinase superfamily protein n=1 Tax=Striga asiatica TaxID=4170 RepID=A0A5A7QDC0_STRAF|nr:protein kinase superfamily protein [Striga asiatica]